MTGTPRPTDPRPITVGVDGSRESELALDWAVDEARRRGLSLHLVHARSARDPGWVIRAARQRVMSLGVDHPVRLVVTEDDVVTTAWAALVAASAVADTLVVGISRQADRSTVLRDSTALRVAARAACPVVVVRRPSSREVAPPQVIVGVDGSSHSDGALAYAFHRASDLGLPLTVIRAWTGHVAVESLRTTDAIADGARAAAVDAQLATLQQTVGPWQEKFPDVLVHVVVAAGNPPSVLVDESRAAELVVVGGHGRGDGEDFPAGSVSAGVLWRARSPVAVVRSFSA